jgi:hypothetical protein
MQDSAVQSDTEGCLTAVSSAELSPSASETWEDLVYSPKDVKKVHPNSLAARAEKDPDLKERIRRGQEEEKQVLAGFEAWYRHGCMAG